MSEKKPRGFAAMSKEKQLEIARQGGKTAHRLGVAHQFTPEEARAAGKRSHELGRAHQFTSDEASEAGRKGGLAVRKNRANSFDE